MTFDDAFASALEHAVECLVRHDAWGTFFAVAGLVGTSAAWEGGSGRPLASWEALAEAQAHGMEIGSHTFSHCDLTKLSFEAQVCELESAEDELIRHGLDCRSVCFPFGRFNDDTLRAMEREDIPVGLALGRRPARASDRLTCLPRIVVSYSDRLPKLLYKLMVRPSLPSFKRRPHYLS